VPPIVRGTAVIADPGSNATATDAQTEAAAPDLATSPLTPEELYQLTLYKWRYSLEAYGFERSEVRDLMFLKWLRAAGKIEP
jgi:hypothetical protein